MSSFDKRLFSLYLKWLFIIISVVLLFLFQIYKPIGMDVDSSTYYEIIKNSGVGYQGYSIEPIFRLILLIADSISDNPYITVLSIYFIIAISLKLYIINKNSEYFLLSFIAYLSFYAILHEIVQIRVGLAAAFLLLSLNDISNKKPIAFFFKIILASICHYSAIIAFPLYLLKPERIDKKIWGLMLLFSIGVSFLSATYANSIVQVFSLIPGVAGAKLARYIELFNAGVHAQIDILNYYNVFLTMLSLFFILHSERIKDRFKVIVIKIFILSQVSFYLLSFLPVLAYRVSELLGISVIYAITYLISFFENKKTVMFIVFMFLVLILYFNLFIKSYIDWSYIK